jgi:hypothetical protein
MQSQQAKYEESREEVCIQYDLKMDVLSKNLDESKEQFALEIEEIKEENQMLKQT